MIMPAPFAYQDQADHAGIQKPLNTDDMEVLRDMLHAQAGNVIRCLQAVRAGDREYDGASMRMTIAHALNLAEACIDTFRGAEAECRQHLAQRETAKPRPRILDFTVIPPAKPFGRRVRDANLPATVSPGALA